MTTKTPEQLAEELALKYSTTGEPNEHIYKLLVLTIEADRAQFFNTSSSASRQHYIDTWRYLLHEEMEA